MNVRVNIEDKMLADPRFKQLGQHLGSTHFEAFGRCLTVWMTALQHRSEFMAPALVDALAERPGFTDAMIAADLAAPQPDGRVRLRGIEERLVVIREYDRRRDLANRARTAKKLGHVPVSSTSTSTGESPAHVPGGVHQLDQDLDLDHSGSESGTRPHASPEPPGKIPNLDAEQNARYQLVTEIWDRLAAARTDLAAELRETIRPLAPFDRGKSELAARVREIGNLERARADCEHVLAVRVDEARIKRELKWLTGAIWGVDSMRAALGMSRQEAKRAKPSGASEHYDANGMHRGKFAYLEGK